MFFFKYPFLYVAIRAKAFRHLEKPWNMLLGNNCYRATLKCETCITSNTYALETCTSCQLLDRFCFNPSKGVRPSFLFNSPQCLSLAARTCLRVPISSSTLERDRHRSQLSQFNKILKIKPAFHLPQNYYSFTNMNTENWQERSGAHKIIQLNMNGVRMAGLWLRL